MIENKRGREYIQSQRRRLKRIADILSKEFPKRESEEGAAPFIDTLIAIILSQGTSDVNSHRAYQSMRTLYPTWLEVAEVDREALMDAIKTGGLAKQKAKAIQNTLQAFLNRWGDLELKGIEAIPDDDLITFLTAIDGVGIKSATCAMMFALDRDLCAVDTHIHRIINRLGLVSASSPEKSFRDLRELIPKGRAHELHVNFIYFGRNICKARLPHCFECPLYRSCQWEEKKEHARAKRRGPKAVSGDFLITEGIS